MSAHTFWLYFGAIVLALLPGPLWSTIIAFIVWAIAVSIVYPKKEVKRANQEEARR